MAPRRSFSGLPALRDDLRQRLASLGLGRQGGRKALQDDEPFVTLQVGKTILEPAPRAMRTQLWLSALQRKGGLGAAAAERYEDMLLSPVSAEALGDIDKDLQRTFPSTRRFAAPEGQAALRRVLVAYAAADPEVGYCQGMNFVAGLLLMYLPERHAFGALVMLMRDRGLRSYYSTDMALVQTHLWQLGRLMPARLCAHLESLGVLPLLYGASWLMTCFSADFPASFSARVLDVIMADKMDEALLKAAVGLLRRVAPRLLGIADMEGALALLKIELPAWEEPALHDVLTEAFRAPWTPQQLALLGSTEGAESVAEALERVQRANLAAAGGGGAGGGSAGGGAAAEGSGGAAAAGGDGGGGGGGSSRPGSAGGGPARGASPGGSGGGALSLGPPPSPRRPLSSASSLRGSDRGSDRGAALDLLSGDEQPAEAGGGGASRGLLRPPPPVRSCSGGADDGPPLIDMSSPRARGGDHHAAAEEAGWDPFAAAPAHAAPPAHAAALSSSPPAAAGGVAALRRELDVLSFSQLSIQHAPGGHPHGSQQHQQQQQQQQPGARPAPRAHSHAHGPSPLHQQAKAVAHEDEWWGEFVASPTAHGHAAQPG
ncbi:Tbc1d4 [Scenedesmus sp. PABB004]|nr:Tbc1d4 [Scenedesmus sp. PABB004]